MDNDNNNNIIKVNKCQECECYELCDFDIDNCIMKETYWVEMSYYRYIEDTLSFKHSEL